MWPHSVKRSVLAGAAALVLAGSALGLAFAQQTPVPTRPPAQSDSGQPGARPGHQAFIDALARRLGITSERLQQAMTEARNEVGMPEHGPGGRGRGPGRGGIDRAIAAQAIGISTDQLRQELPGKSLAQVAQDHGRSPSDVANALKNAANQRLDQEVASGRLPADQASQMKQQIAQRIDQIVTEVRPQGGPGMNGRSGGPQGFPGGPAAARTPTSTNAPRT